MKQAILEALQLKFSGVDAKMLEPTAKKLAKTTKEEDVATSVEGVTLQQVIESYADSRANQASETAANNAVAAYEKKHGLKEGTKVDESGGALAHKSNPKPATNSSDDEPSWAKAIREQNERILQRYEQEEQAKTQAGYGTRLVELLKEKGVRESFYAPAIKGRTFKDEDEISAFAESIVQSFQDDEQVIANGKHSASHKPDTSQGGGDGEDLLLKAAQEKTEELAKSSLTIKTNQLCPQE